MNQAKVSVFIARSLDGYIAAEDGSVDWLNEASAQVPKGEDCGYKRFMETVDVLVMGRRTFEQVLTFGAWPYGGTRVVVLSSELTELPEGVPREVSLASEAPKDLHRRLSDEGVNHIYVDGGKTINGFLDAGLVNEITITTIPLLIGSGIPLFGTAKKSFRLTHLETVAYEFGFVKSSFAVCPADAQA